MAREPCGSPTSFPGQNKIRVEWAVGLEPGSYITVKQAAVTENAVVRVADQIGNFISLDKPLANNYPLGAVDVTIVSKEFDLTIQAPGNPDEETPRISPSIPAIAASSKARCGIGKHLH